jgi:AAHS family 4-hydroxybenzoate transporter-like MFS transporter
MVLASGEMQMAVGDPGKTGSIARRGAADRLTVVLDGWTIRCSGWPRQLLHEWGLERSVLGGIFALGFVGMALGTLAAGQIGDRSGGAWRCCWASRCSARDAGDRICRSGLAAGAAQSAGRCRLGGVPGTAAAMIAEFTTARWRSLAVTFGVVCVSIGGILGGARRP